MQHARRVRETVEVLSQPFRGFGWHFGVEEEAAEFLSRSENLLTAVAVPARVCGGQIEEFQRPFQGTPEPAGPASSVESDRTFHLAACVSELFDELQPVPAACRDTLVEGAAHLQWIIPR